jgi:hypothetical protein
MQKLPLDGNVNCNKRKMFANLRSKIKLKSDCTWLLSFQTLVNPILTHKGWI